MVMLYMLLESAAADPSETNTPIVAWDWVDDGSCGPALVSLAVGWAVVLFGLLFSEIYVLS